MNWRDRIVVDAAIKAWPQLTGDDVKAGLEIRGRRNGQQSVL